MTIFNIYGVFLTFLVFLQSGQGEDYIFGGGATHKNQYPWLVAVCSSRTLGESCYCGGTLLSSRIVLTAAHCTWRKVKKGGKVRRVAFDASEIFISVGEYDLLQRDGEQVYGVSRYHLHPDLHAEQYLDNDFAIIRLKQAVRMSSSVQTACLPNPHKSYEHKSVIAAGWGKTEGNFRLSTPLKVEMKTLSNNHCQRLVDKIKKKRNLQITKNMICTTGYKKGVCNGDSGGPLMVKGTNTVIGVASWVPFKQCNQYGYVPSMFARLTRALRWIQRYTSGETCTD